MRIKMKYVIYAALLACVYQPACAQTGKEVVRIKVANTTNLQRVSEIITLLRKDLKQGLPDTHAIVKENGKKLVTQEIDNDGDGSWDKLLVAVDLKPHGFGMLTLSWSQEPQNKQAPQFTNVRFSLKTKSAQPEKEIEFLTRGRGFTQDIANPVYQMEGPGIENDKVAFRMFFDKRNSMDIYGKITSKPILAQVGVAAGWHTLQPWGMDIFKTGTSLGAGGLAVTQGNQLTRLGDADTSVFRALHKGALEAAMRVNYRSWDIGSRHGNGSETISMQKGNFYYKNEITVPLQQQQQLAVGIANFTGLPLKYKRHNQSFSSVSIYAPQAEGTGTKLGVAVIFPTDDYSGIGNTDSTSANPNTSYITLKNRAAAKTTIYFVACWEKTDPAFSTRVGFDAYLHKTAKRLANPIRVIILK